MNDTSALADALRGRLNGNRSRPTVDHIIHMPGAEPKRSANEIRLYLTLDDHRFGAIVPDPDRQIDLLIGGWNELLALAKKGNPKECRGDDRQTTKDMIRDMLIEDRHLAGGLGNVPALMAAGVAWMIFGPSNPIAEVLRLRRPKEAGFEITNLGPRSYNWRQMITNGEVAS